MKWTQLFFWRRRSCNKGNTTHDTEPESCSEHGLDDETDRFGRRLAKLTAKHDRDLNRITRRMDAAFDRLEKHVETGVETALVRMEGRHAGITAALEAASRATIEGNQQLAALREYAAQQQNLIRRFQDGYDLKILRDITLRVMIVVDGIEKTMDTEEANPNGLPLARVREDLLVALDASGMEAFAPTLGVMYQGLEKEVEVVRTEHVTTPCQAGTITRIVRRGLRYVGTEGNTRVIRTAQVVVAKQKETEK